MIEMEDNYIFCPECNCTEIDKVGGFEVKNLKYTSYRIKCVCKRCRFEFVLVPKIYICWKSSKNVEYDQHI